MITRVRNRSGLLRNFLAANAIVLACSLPLYVAIRLVAGTLHNSLGFVPLPTTAFIWYDIESLYLMRVCDFMTPHFMSVPTPQVLTVVVNAGLGMAALGGIWRLRHRPMLAAALLPAALTLPLLFGFCSIWRPVLMARYLLWSAPPVAIIMGIGISAALEKCPPPARHAALAAAALLLVVNLIPYYRAETKPRWDVAAQILAANAQPQDAVYYFEWGAATTMEYYLPAKAQPYLRLDFTGDLQQAERERAQGKRVWAIYGDAWTTRHWLTPAEFKATLAPLGAPCAEWRAGSRIVMWVYDPVRK